MDEVRLAERLIAHDTSDPAGLAVAMDFAAGWLEGRGADLTRHDLGDREALIARAGSGPVRIIFHGHIDVVPGHPDQFSPRIEGNRLIGRGAYDMKAALAAMMIATSDLAAAPPAGVQVELVIVPDEERAQPGANATEMLVDQGLRADLVVCGEPTDMQVGVQAKGVMILAVEVEGRAAHGSTPWLGDNAILRALEVYRRLESLPFTRASTPLFPRPSVNLGRISGGDAVNKVPDLCRMDVDVRYLPGQDPDEILRQAGEVGASSIEVSIARPPADTDPEHPLVLALVDCASRHHESSTSVGRDGASDGVSFLSVGVPAVEFGPLGAGHHGPDEHVDIPSLLSYRRALADFAVAAGELAPVIAHRRAAEARA
ncbi:MAG: M20/M25/M40 family metallo-hydrolase [Acidobacteria bacterium]|nr:M20/M25/M40 family metallo-hydrolase [Acidobacteriota bacterium]